MLFIRSEQIEVKERQRKKFDQKPLDDLETSIDANGVIHPPAVRFQDGQFILVAGERRLRAMSALIAKGKQIRHGEILCEPGLVPVLNMGALNDLQAFEIELHENIRRQDLSWQERAIAEARLYEIRTYEAAAKNLPPPTFQAIATEVLQRQTGTTARAEGLQVTSVADRIRLADHLSDPEVAKAKNEAEAIKVVRRKQEAARVQTLAQAFDAEVSDKSPHQLLLGDFREHIAGIADASVDVLLTDPPYGIDADSFGDQAGTGHAYEDSEKYFAEIIDALACESFRVCKPQAHAYVFCDPRHFSDIQLAFSFAGWAVWPIPIIWDKGNGMLPRPEHAPRRTYEMILFASKGDRPVRLVKPDVIRISGVRDLKHGAQKPVSLYVDLLSRSAFPGDLVLDTFAGSGTIFPAANQTKVKAIGIELSAEYGAVAKLRMTGEEDEVPGLDDLDTIEI